jgi:hypothetical protein
MAKGGKRRLIPREAAEGAEDGSRKHLTSIERQMLGLTEDNSDREKAYVALTYYQSAYECFSDWTKEELRSFSSFCDKVNERTWEQIKQSGGTRGRKTGLGFTPHRDRRKLPSNGLPGLISPEVEFSEMRVTDKARVHGFRMKSAFFLVWLDKDHRVYAE